jgi:hypothetical protein
MAKIQKIRPRRALRFSFDLEILEWSVFNPGCVRA